MADGKVQSEAEVSIAEKIEEKSENGDLTIEVVNNIDSEKKIEIIDNHNCQNEANQTNEKYIMKESEVGKVNENNQEKIEASEIKEENKHEKMEEAKQDSIKEKNLQEEEKIELDKNKQEHIEQNEEKQEKKEEKKEENMEEDEKKQETLEEDTKLKMGNEKNQENMMEKVEKDKNIKKSEEKQKNIEKVEKENEYNENLANVNGELNKQTKKHEEQFGMVQQIEVDEVNSNEEKQVNEENQGCDHVKELKPDDKNKIETKIEEKIQEDCEEETLENKILRSNELFNSGSRHYLLKNYQQAADELGEVCELFEEIHGSQSSELGMPLLLYAKSLIALSLEENKVLDVPEVDEEADDNDDVVDETVNEEKLTDSKIENTVKSQNGDIQANGTLNENEMPVSTSNPIVKIDTNLPSTSAVSNEPSTSKKFGDDEAKENGTDEDEEDTDATNLQIAWETLELAAKIFMKQGEKGFPQLAEIHTELGNIQFENEIFDAAREDYGKALKIYSQLPVKEHRRDRAEIHYKIGLTYLLQTMNKEGSESFKTACDLLSEEVEDIKSKTELSENDENTIKDIEETQQDIKAKIVEIEETRQQVLDEVRAALDKYKSPSKQKEENGVSNSSSPSTSSSSKPNDISHLIKRKKPDTSGEVEESPAKRLNVENTG